MKKIMLACSAGMSTSLLVSKMEQEAEKQGLEVEIFAVPASEAEDHLTNTVDKVDILLLGPQVRFMKSQFDKKVAGTATLVDVIDMQAYGMMDGAKVLATAMAQIAENN